MPFCIIRNDITKVKADAIVNTANPDVAVGSGVDSAIYKAAGKERLLAERKKIGALAVGDVAITPAFDLDAKYIIHSSGPVWRGGNMDEKKLLRQCYDKSLLLAFEHGCKSIAFPLMATGAYLFPKEIGMQIAIDAFTSFLKNYDMDITLVVYTDYEYSISGKWAEDVEDYLDEQDDKITEESQCFSMDFGAVGNIPDEMPVSESIEMSEDVSERMDRGSVIPDSFVGATRLSKPRLAESDLEDALKDIYTDSFEKHLQQLINKKGMKNSEVYTDANISKQYFSKLMKGQVKPSKEKVLSLAVGLHLNMDETVDFLSLAGYALSPISQTDKIVEYHILREEYSVMKINIVLFDYGLPMLSDY